jgi:hypothetical protein
MSIVRNRAGVLSIPALITAYLVFVSLDLYTTWLASPNLSLEGNKLIQLFDLDWPIIISGAYTFSISISILFIYANKHLTKHYFNSSSHKIVLKDVIFTRKNAILFLIFIIFFSHLLISVFVTINNILSYIYLHKIENHLTSLSIKYLEFKALFSPNFYLYSYSILCCFSIIASYLLIRKTITKKPLI